MSRLLFEHGFRILESCLECGSIFWLMTLVGTDYYSNMVLEFRVMSQMRFYILAMSMVGVNHYSNIVLEFSNLNMVLEFRVMSCLKCGSIFWLMTLVGTNYYSNMVLESRVMSKKWFYILAIGMVGPNYCSNIILEFRVLPNMVLKLLVCSLKYSGLDCGLILECTLTC